MPLEKIFNNRTIVEPGAYTKSKGGEPLAPEAASFGRVIIIDTGSGAGYGGGQGINGAKYQGKKTIQYFDDLQKIRNWQRGGLLWDILPSLFRPARDPNVKGCTDVAIIKAATTTAPTIAYTFSGGGSAGGTLSIKPLSEGIGANGVVNATSSLLQTGFAAKMVAGTEDSAKFVIEFWKGNYRGLDDANVPYDGILDEESQPEKLVQSVEFDNVQEVIDWMGSDYEFQKYFYLDASTVIGTGVIDSADLTANIGYELATGGAETYGATDLDDVLDVIDEEENTFFLCDKFGIADGKDTENTKIYTHILTESIYQKFMVVGGGSDISEFDQSGASSINLAQFYDSSHVYVIHGTTEEPKIVGAGLRTLNTLYTAAKLCGRLAGVEPQVPITWKNLNVTSITHELKTKERSKALKAGVVHFKEVEGEWVINQEITTLQKNNQQIYPDGQSPEGSIMRIDANLQKFLKKNMALRAVGQNINLASPADVQSYMETLLNTTLANKIDDNLIIKYFNIKVELENGDYNISFGYETNGPINRVFITSFIYTPAT